MSGKPDSIQETITLISSDEKNRAYFFSKAKDRKWFEPLKANGFFDSSTIPQPVKKEKGFVLFFWPQQSYLEHLSVQIKNKAISDTTFIESFLDVLRSIATTKGNFYLSRSLFLITTKMPLALLKVSDIQRVFEFLLDGDSLDTLTETTVQEGLDLILTATTDSPHERSLFKEFAKHLLAISQKEKHRGRDPKLVFFSDWSYKEFRDKHFNVEKLVNEKSFVLFDTIEVAEKILTDILSSTDLDESTRSWRPAIEEHHQNNYHDSAQAILVGAIAMCALALVNKGHSLPQLDGWKNSSFKTLNRLYIFISSQLTDPKEREEAAQKILDLDFAYECGHEIYHFLAKQFEHLTNATQTKILDYIEQITTDYADTEEMNNRHTAWAKLRWLEALSASSNSRVKALRASALVITDNGVPEHPDFGSYMGATWVGPTSPKDEKWLSTATFDEVLDLLLTFENTQQFASPSIEGLVRVLESWTVSDPMKASALINEFDKLNPQYISALLDGYSKSWTEKKYVPVNDLLVNIRKLIAAPDFAKKVEDETNRMGWAVSSICRFIEAGTRSDDHAFDPSLNDDCYFILKECLAVTSADKRYGNSSDAYTRAINEPRGRIFEALIILALRRARLAKADATAFAKAWGDLHSLIEPILRKQDEHEVSLHAHIGAYYRQFQFLSKDWLMQNMDLIVPPRSEKPTLWGAFMDGFSYVTDYSRDIYSYLKNNGHLLNYLRFDVDSDGKSSRRDRLQTRMIELSLVAYVLGDESLDDGIIATILKEKNSEEWHQMIWSVQSVIGNNPKPEHLQKAKDLISRLIDIRNSDASGVDFTERFRGLGRFLDLIKDPMEEIVEKIITLVASDKESPWELGDLIDYLHQFKDSHPKRVGQLFKLMLEVSKAAPAWPPEKVKDISTALIQHGEKDRMIDVCRIYSERSPTCEPIREICVGIGKK